MMSLNRYRLKHLLKKGNQSARRAERMLGRPDRLLGTILVGNNIVNILAASLATIVAVRIWGDAGIAVATVALTDRKSTRLNSSHVRISYAVFCLKKKTLTVTCLW